MTNIVEEVELWKSRANEELRKYHNEHENWKERIVHGNENGFKKEDLEDGNFALRDIAEQYFEKCMNILGIDANDFTYEFSESEIKLLEMNNIPVKAFCDKSTTASKS